jgi:hypothetical protein
LQSLAESNDSYNVAALRFNKGSDDVSAVDLAARSSVSTYGWYMLERRAPKPALTPFDIETTNSDNAYRITASRLLRVLKE